MSEKKVRCTCLRCKATSYQPAAKIDTAEPFLCADCDGRFITWSEGTGRNVAPDEMLKTFLKERPCKR